MNRRTFINASIYIILYLMKIVISKDNTDNILSKAKIAESNFKEVLPDNFFTNLDTLHGPIKRRTPSLEPVVGHGALLFANRVDIRKIDLETSENTVVMSGLRSAVAIDYDFQKKLVVWSDVLERRIYSANDNGESVQTIVKDNIITPDGLAVDWIHGNVYWTDADWNAISVASLDGKLIKLLFGTNLDKPRAIVVNPLEGWMFWTDWGKQAKIERAGMDGTHRSTIVSRGIRWPSGLAIDFVSKKIYWADGWFSTLCSSDYDGSNVKVINQSVSEMHHPFALDVFEDWLYWTDRKSIYKMDRFTEKNAQIVSSGFYSPLGLRVYHSYKQPTGPNYCGQKNGECSHFCLPAPQVTQGSAKYTCACPDGMVLTDNQQNCIIIGAITTGAPSPPPYSTTRRITTATIRINPDASEYDTTRPIIRTSTTPGTYVRHRTTGAVTTGAPPSPPYSTTRRITTATIRINPDASVYDTIRPIIRTSTTPGTYVRHRTTDIPCSCGEGMITCIPTPDGKLCKCVNDRMVFNGMCTDCECYNGVCFMNGGIPSCRCLRGFGLQNDTCVECHCGAKKQFCHFVEGLQFCNCNDEYISVNEKCEDCICGKDEVCLKRPKIGVCTCPKGSGTWDDEECDECDCSDGKSCMYVGSQKLCTCMPRKEKLNGTCVECDCGENAECEFVDGEKTCSCQDGYEMHNGTCEECDCGEGHSCTFKNGSSVCICAENYYAHNGTCKACTCGPSERCEIIDGEKFCICKENFIKINNSCIACWCGEGHACNIVDGKKLCLCQEGFAANNGKCEKCDCGANYASCEFQNGNKECECHEGYASNNGICQECFCGKNSTCVFEDDEKLCFCPEDQQHLNGTCIVWMCLDDTCHRGTCEVNENGFFCNCEDGYLGHRCDEEALLSQGAIYLISVLSALTLFWITLLLVYIIRKRNRYRDYHHEKLDATMNVLSEGNPDSAM